MAELFFDVPLYEHMLQVFSRYNFRKNPGSNNNKRKKLIETLPIPSQFLGRPKQPARQYLEGANRPKAFPGRLLPKNVSKTYDTSKKLERFDL